MNEVHTFSIQIITALCAVAFLNKISILKLGIGILWLLSKN